MTTCWKTSSCLTSCLCDSTAGSCSSKTWLGTRSAVGRFMAKAGRSQKCVAPPLCMPQKRSRLRYISGAVTIHPLCFGLSVKTLCLPLVGGVPRGPDLWRDPKYTPLWVPRWEGSRQCPAGSYRGCSRTISSPGWGWRARANRASS